MRKNKIPVVYYVAVLLLCFVMVTLSMTSGLLAKYAVYDEADDSARVAKFDVTVSNLTAVNTNLNTFTDNSINTGATYSFSVTSNSEVAVKYQVVVALNTTELPDWFGSILLDSTVAPTSHGYNSTSGRYEFVFENVGNFPAGESNTANHSFVIKTGAGVFDPSYNDQALTVTVDVVATQID